MGDEFGENFDLPTLLKYGSLDIRGVAERDRNLLTNDYFALLLKFAIFLHEAEESLARIADQKSTNDDFQSLSEFIRMLEGIGCFKLIPDIIVIIDAGKQGDKASASVVAKRVKDDISILDALLKRARKKADPSNTSHDANSSALNEAQFLKRDLSLLDYQEATRKLRILAVDDAPVMLKIITSSLSNEYNVFGMSNPNLVEKFLQQITPELFLLDYLMPGLNGFELVPIIRSFEEHKKTPIIYLTSQGTMDNISTAVSLGACDFIVKPFQADTLREKIARHIVRKKAF